MIIGIGTDILNKNRVCQVISSENQSFISRVYSEAELIEAGKSANDITFYLGTRFAGKEAVFKTLSIPSSSKIYLREIQILNDVNGIPYVELKGEMARTAKERGITKILISLSYDTDYIIAYATAIAD